MSEQTCYNPLDKLNLGKSVAYALLQSPVRPLSDRKGLTGAGVYAIYYTGDFPPYENISRKNTGATFDQPIYVGKAIPAGGRKGGAGLLATGGRALGNRLSMHAASITQARNINIADFCYRSLVVDDIWIPLGENMLIEKFQPLWNRVIDGFGNNTPGVRRGLQQRSQWDTIHPGRKYVEKLNLPLNPLTEEEVLHRINVFFEGNLSLPEILNIDAENEEENYEDTHS